MGVRPSSDQGSPQRGQCISMVHIQRPSARRTSPEVNHDHDAPTQRESHKCSTRCSWRRSPADVHSRGPSAKGGQRGIGPDTRAARTSSSVKSKSDTE